MSSVNQAASSRLKNIADKFDLSTEQVLAKLSENGYRFYIPIPHGYVAVAVDSKIFDGQDVDNRELYSILIHLKPLVLKSARMLQADPAYLLSSGDFWCKEFNVALQFDGVSWSYCDTFSISAEKDGRRATMGGRNIILQRLLASDQGFGDRYSDLREAEVIQITIDDLHVDPAEVENAMAIFYVVGKGIELLLDLNLPHYTQSLRVMWDVFRETWFIPELKAQDVRRWKNLALSELRSKGDALKSDNASEAALNFITPRDFNLIRQNQSEGVVKLAKRGEIDPRFDCLLEASNYFWRPYFSEAIKSIDHRSGKVSQAAVAQYILDANGKIFTKVESNVAAAIINPFYIKKIRR